MSEVDIRNMELTEADETLRLIAALPAPEGLAGRVRESLRAASLIETGRSAKVIEFPARRSWLDSAWRSAAAAAIVCVVAGGAWWISALAGAGAGTSAVSTPVAVRPAGGFSSAGAVRTPETLNGPVLEKKPESKQDEKKPAGSAKKAEKKDSAIVPQK